jgi:prevent-host-death family protein
VPRDQQQTRLAAGPLETVSLRQLQKHAREVLNNLETYDHPVVITREGRPVAVLVSIDTARNGPADPTGAAVGS